MGRRVTNSGRRGELRFVVLGAGVVLLAATAVTGLAFLAAQRLDIEFSDLSRDPASIVGAPPYTGWFANVTIMVWQVPAVVALFTALIVRRSGGREATRMFLVVGLISTVMVGDDFFQGHEILQYNLGVPGAAVFATYTVAALGWAWRFRRRLGAHLLTVLAAMACWGVSAAVDTLLNENAPYALEDGAKLAGVALWGFMVVRIALVTIAERSPGVPHIPAQRSGPARHRADGARPSARGPLPVEVRRPTEILAPRDPEATAPLRRVSAHRHSTFAQISVPAQVPPPARPPLPFSGPQPVPRRRPLPAPESAPLPVWSPPRVVHDIRGPATPPPVRRPGPVQHPPRR